MRYSIEKLTIIKVQFDRVSDDRLRKTFITFESRLKAVIAIQNVQCFHKRDNKPPQCVTGEIGRLEPHHASIAIATNGLQISRVFQKAYERSNAVLAAEIMRSGELLQSMEDNSALGIVLVPPIMKSNHVPAQQMARFSRRDLVEKTIASERINVMAREYPDSLPEAGVPAGLGGG
ncbi:hypothetical protein [Bradyrhizobium sp. USDA 3458]|uniref:hypothetical protein n=1 Tax=Bradyrhizobium sp. USDA 3458 TaxID=2591461 RepID=UPI001330EABC|nr:hypothetical protein [Bradyrhizobium sp. USDA 3458]